MPTPTWDPEQYARFADERSRPFFDLLARVTCSPATVADLGCGPGTLTATLCERWPAARVVGVDSSTEMLAAARLLACPGRLDFQQADLREWAPQQPLDLIVSNAALQWVPGHRRLLGRLAGQLAPGGVLAFQVPGNFHAPSHTLLRQLLCSDPWRRLAPSTASEGPAVAEPVEYLEELLAAGMRAQVWETTYFQVLQGADPVLEWLRGTALRPVLAELGEERGAAFCAQLRPLLAEAYPPTELGTVLPYRRLFAVARREPAG